MSSAYVASKSNKTSNFIVVSWTDTSLFLLAGKHCTEHQLGGGLRAATVSHGCFFALKFF